MDIISILSSFGLSKTESLVYLAGLKRPQSTATELAELSGVKRTTLYPTLATLEKKGFLKSNKSNKIQKFRMESPEHLLRKLERKKSDHARLEKKLTKALPLFPNIEHFQFGLPNIEVFRGKEGLKNLGEKAFKTSGVIKTIAPSFSAATAFASDDDILWYMKERASRNIKTKSIWVDMPKNKKMLSHKNFQREVRIAPKGFIQENKTKIDIFDNTVLVINLLPELTGMLIQSVDYTVIMTSLWDLLWKASIPMNKVKS